MNKAKQIGFALALGAVFVIAPAFSTFSTVQAQNGRWQQQRRNDRNRNGVNDRYEQDRNRNGVADGYEIDRNQNGVADGYETRRTGVDRNRNGVDDRYENDPRYRNGNGGYYGNDGYYGNNGNNGYNNAEVQKGYRDGLDRGRKDAQTNRAMDPNNSSHYRNGNQAYRAGFERGFNEAFRQYSGRRW